MLPPAALERERRLALAAVQRVLRIDAWPDVPVRWNRRLRRAGRAVIDHHRGRFRGAVIELSPAYFEVYPEDLGGILVHEAVHVGLALLARPFGHGPEFRDACGAAGGLLHSRWLPGRIFRYRCPVCAAVLERRRRTASAHWCAACVEAAGGNGADPWAPQRALQLVETAFQGPEPPEQRTQPVCDGPAPRGEEGGPLRYPVPGPAGHAPGRA